MELNLPFDNFLEKIKWFIYLTNEFGAPTGENISQFIANFSRIVINGNFIMGDAKEKFLQSLYEEIKSEEYINYTGGIDFYVKLSRTEIKSVDELRKFIESYLESLPVEANSIETNKNSLKTISDSARKYSELALEIPLITAHIPDEIIIDIMPPENKVVVTECKNIEFIGQTYKSLEELTLAYILNSLGKNCTDIDEPVIILYKKYLSSWKQISDSSSIDYLYEEE